jgi:hypothetical protein
VRLETDSLAHVKFGLTPVATAANKRIQPNTPEYFGVDRGQETPLKVSAYDGTS